MFLGSGSAVKTKAQKPTAKKTAPAKAPAKKIVTPVAAKKPVAKPAPVKAVEVVKLNAKDKSDLREMLQEMRRDLVSQIGMLKDESLQRHDSVNSEEDGTDQFDRQLALSVASSENESLMAIDEALERVEEGTYGVCQQCGQTIGKARLKALPFVTMCVGCKSEAEKQDKHMRGAHLREVEVDTKRRDEGDADAGDADA